MPTPEERALQERARQELERRTRRAQAAAASPPPLAAAPAPVVSESAQPGFLDRALSVFDQGVTAAQREGAYALREVASPDFWRDMSDGVPSAFLAVNPVDRIRAGLAESPASRLLAARAYQSVNPFVMGELGERTIENDPNYQRGAVALADTLGDVPAAALQAGAQIIPGAVVEASAGIVGRGVPLAAEAAMNAPTIARRALQGGLASMYTNAAQNALGAESGQRASTFGEGLTDPKQALLSFGLGAAPGAVGDLMARREANYNPMPIAGIDAMNPTVQAAGRFRESAPIVEEIRREVLASRQAAVASTPPAAPMTANPVAASAFLPQAETLTQPFSNIDPRMMAEMDPDARSTYVVDTANEMLARLDTIVDPAMAEKVRARGGLPKIDAPEFASGKPVGASEATNPGRTPRRGQEKISDPNATVELRNATPEDRAHQIIAIADELGAKVRTIVDETPLANQRVVPNTPEAVYDLPSYGDPSRNAPTYVGLARTRRGGNAETVATRAPQTAEVSPLDGATVWAENAELPNPRAAAQRRNAETVNAGPMNLPPLREVEARVRGQRSGAGGATPTDPMSVADMARMTDTQSMDLADAARISGENPAMANEIMYGPGRRNMGAARSGKDTQVMWNRDILNEQARRERGMGATQPMTNPQVLAEINARQDPRTVETPGEPVQPGGMPKGVETDAMMEDAKFALDHAKRSRNPSILQELAKKALLPEFRAGPLVAAAVRSVKAAHHIQNVQVARLFPQLRAAYAEAKKNGSSRIIDKYINQNLSPESHKGPMIPVQALPSRFRELFAAGMEQSDGFRNELIRAGYFTEQQVKEMGERQARGQVWLHRDYKAFLDSGYLPDVARMDRAIRWVVEHSRGKMDYDTARAELTNLLTGDGNAEARFQKYRQSKLNKEILRGRQNIPPIIRDVLGEINDASYVTASSMSEIERMWRQHKTSESFTAPELKGITWDDKPTKAMAQARVWQNGASEAANKRAFGMFAGKYVAPELYESIMQAPMPQMQSTVQRILTWMTGAFKTAKVAMSPVTYMNNWISNSTYAAAAGLPVWNGRFAARMTQSARALMSYGDTYLTTRSAPDMSMKATDFSKDARWVQWALEDGTLIAGTGAEFGGNQARAIAQQFLRDKKKGLIGFLDTGWDALQRGKAKAGAFYDALDSHWRLAVYIEQVTKGRERLGLSIPEARARASRIVNENFASSGSVGEAVREMSKQTGFLAPFMTWHADNLRVHYNWLVKSGKGFAPTDAAGKRLPRSDVLAGEGSGQAMNVALHYGLISGLFTGARYLYGFSDQEVAAAEGSLKSSYRANNPEWVRQWLPWRDANGRPQVISLVPMFPSAMFLKGDPETNLLTRVATNTVLGFVQSAAAEDPVKRALASVGLAERDFKPEVLPGQEGRAALEAAWNYIEPGIIRDARNVARRLQVAGDPRRFEEPYTPGQAAAYFSPFRAEPVGNSSRESERRREVAQRNDARANQTRINKLTVEDEEKQRLRKKAQEVLNKRALEASKRSKAVRRTQ